MQRAIGRIAESDCPVLILGERGAGKRFIAGVIQAQTVHSRGAFNEIPSGTASIQALREAFSAKGAVYLSEIEELSVSLQEFIVQNYFRSEQAQNCRLLCGSSRDLLEEVKSWRMREDFYYLVSGVTLQLPPLRCRKSEILAIADELMAQYAKQFDRPRPVLCEEITGYLLEYSWPGNFSELQTAIKTFVAIGDQKIALTAIKAAASAGASNGDRRPHLLKAATKASSIQIERQLISEVLVSTGGNRKRAAADLGISYKALLYKLKQIESENQSAICKNGVAQ
jgi:DNA-binding NtrC family response regulator